MELFRIELTPWDILELISQGGVMGHGYGPYGWKIPIPLLIGFFVVWFLWYKICRWRIFSKAGEHGWASLIPFYNTFTYFKIVFGQGSKMWLMLIPIYNIILSIQSKVHLAKVFGKGGGFGAGLFFLRPLFLLILAFGKAKYVGTGMIPPFIPAPVRQKPVEHFVFCQNCGAKMNPGAVFCNQCGASVLAAAPQPAPEKTASAPQPEPKAEPVSALCPACGAALKPNALFCSQCGKMLEQSAPVEPASIPQPEPKAEPSPALCPACGAALKPNALFCSQCGKTLEQSAPSGPLAEPAKAPASRVCPACGADLSALKPDVMFCNKCGASLSGETTPTAKVPAKKSVKSAKPGRKFTQKQKGALIGSLAGVTAAVLLVTAFWQPGFVWLIKNQMRPVYAEREIGRFDYSSEAMLNYEFKRKKPAELPKSGSKAIKVRADEGFTLSADKNALDEDREFTIEKLSLQEGMEKFSAVSRGANALLAAYEVDAGLPDDEQFPGTIDLEFDMKKQGIPEEMWDMISAVRIGDDGSVKELVSERKGSKLISHSRQNSIIGYAILATLGAGAAWGTHQELTKEKAGIIADDPLEPHYRFPFKGKYASYVLTFSEQQILRDYDKNGAFKEVKKKKDLLKKTLDQEAMNAAHGINERYLAAAADLSRLCKETTGNPEWVKENFWNEKFDLIEKNMKIADDYLFGHRKFRVPDYVIEVLPSEKSGDAYAYTVNMHLAKPFVVVYTSGDDFLSQPGNVLLTMTHELFHVVQNEYLSCGKTENSFLPFSEATAAMLEREAEKYYVQQGIGGVQSGQAMNLDKYLVDLQFKLFKPRSRSKSLETISQHHGYGAAGLLEQIRDSGNYGEDFLLILMEQLGSWFTDDYVDILVNAIGAAGDEQAEKTLQSCYAAYLHKNLGKLMMQVGSYEDLNNDENNTVLSSKNELSPFNRYWLGMAPVSDYTYRARKLYVKNTGGWEYTVILVNSRNGKIPVPRQDLCVTAAKDGSFAGRPLANLTDQAVVDLGKEKLYSIAEFNSSRSKSERFNNLHYEMILLMQPPVDALSYKVEVLDEDEADIYSNQELVIELPQPEKHYGYTVTFSKRRLSGALDEVPLNELFIAEPEETEFRLNMQELLDICKVKDPAKLSFTLREHVQDPFAEEEDKYYYGPESQRMFMDLRLADLIGTYSGNIKFKKAEASAAAYAAFDENQQDEEQQMSKGQCDMLATYSIRKMDPIFKEFTISPKDLKNNTCYISYVMKATTEESIEFDEVLLMASARFEDKQLIVEADGEEYRLKVGVGKDGIPIIRGVLPMPTNEDLEKTESDPYVYIYTNIHVKKVD